MDDIDDDDELACAQQRVETFEHRTRRLIEMLDDRIGRHNMPFIMRVEVEDLERMTQ